MKLFDLIDAQAARRAARRRDLLDRGLDWRSLAKLTFEAMDAKLLIASAVIGLFAWAFARNMDDETMKGALIGAFAAAWGYYLGSSNTASRANDRADRALEVTDRAISALPAPPIADVELRPGETATVGTKAD